MVTGWSGRTDEAPFAGVIVTLAAAGLFEGVVPDAPGLPLLCDVPEDVESACELLHALLSSNTAQNPATARPRFLTELLNMRLSSPVMRRAAGQGYLPTVAATHKACAWPVLDQFVRRTAGPPRPAAGDGLHQISARGPRGSTRRRTRTA